MFVCMHAYACISVFAQMPHLHIHIPIYSVHACVRMRVLVRPIGRPWTGGVRGEGSKLVDGGGPSRLP